MNPVKALVLTGYGLNCDYETDYALKLAGAESHRIHINELVRGRKNGRPLGLADFHILVFGGGFSWGDDHGAGVLMAAKIKHHLERDLDRFIEAGKLILGICNGFQALVNLGLLPGFDGRRLRRVALVANDHGNFIDTWVHLRVHPHSACVFTRGISSIELPVRHGEGKFYGSRRDITRLLDAGQAALQYADEAGSPARGQWPLNPNGSLEDIAGICDSTGRILGLMPHPEAFNHYTNHPDWTRRKEHLIRARRWPPPAEGDGTLLFRNAVEYVRSALKPA